MLRLIMHEGERTGTWLREGTKRTMPPITFPDDLSEVTDAPNGMAYALR